MIREKITKRTLPITKSPVKKRKIKKLKKAMPIASKRQAPLKKRNTTTDMPVKISPIERIKFKILKK